MPVGRWTSAPDRPDWKTLGFSCIFLWVLEDNDRTRRFYERFGFLPSEDFLKDRIGGKDVRENRYTLEKAADFHLQTLENVVGYFL